MFRAFCCICTIKTHYYGSVLTYLLTYLLTYYLLTPSAPADRQDPLPILRCPGNASMLRRVFPDHLITPYRLGTRVISLLLPPGARHPVGALYPIRLDHTHEAEFDHTP